MYPPRRDDGVVVIHDAGEAASEGSASMTTIGSQITTSWFDTSPYRYVVFASIYESLSSSLSAEQLVSHKYSCA